jgi:hypothetical protein
MSQAVLRTYLSPAAFYASRPARRPSRERDLGLFWRSRRGRVFRAAWVHDTGELYLVQHALGGPGGGSVHLLADGMAEPELERRIDGWRDRCGEPGSLEWLLGRIDGEAAPRPAMTHAARPRPRRPDLRHRPAPAA